MRKYKIRKQTLQKAKDLGVKVVPSKKKDKKIDVLRNNETVSIGATGYNDYHSYMEDEGKAVADVKRSAFRKRHDCSNKKIGSAGYYACNLLW